MSGASAEEIQTAKIRSGLAATPGAFRCLIGGCQVITQGGQEGLRLHRQQIHPDENWISEGEEGA